MPVPGLAKLGLTGVGAKPLALGLATVLAAGGVVAWHVARQPESEWTGDQARDPHRYPMEYVFTFTVVRDERGNGWANVLVEDQRVEIGLADAAQCQLTTRGPCGHYQGQPLYVRRPVTEGACDPNAPTTAFPVTVEAVFPDGQSSSLTTFHYCPPPPDGAPVRTVQTLNSAFEGWGAYVVRVTWLTGWANQWWGNHYGVWKETAQTIEHEHVLRPPGAGWLK